MRAWALLVSAAAHAGLVAAFPTGSAAPEEPARPGIPVLFAAAPAPPPLQVPPAAEAAPVEPTTPAATPAAPTPPPPKPDRRRRVPQPAAAPPPSAAAPAGSERAATPEIAALPPSAAPAEPSARVPASRPVAGIEGNPVPEYPQAARRRGQEGTVRLRVEVASDGTAADAAVIESSGHRLLDEAALRAVRRWRFRPAMVADRPIATSVEIPIAFRLDGAR